MGAKFRVMPFEFDRIMFSHWLRELPRVDVPLLADMMGVTPGAIVAWQNGRWDENFPHPSMSNFIACCNHLDIDPRLFFVLRDCEHEVTHKHKWIDSRGHVHDMIICDVCGRTVDYIIRERKSPKGDE